MKSTQNRRLKKAQQLVEKKCVKLHRFQPSGRELWTVVGREGDQLVDPAAPYCSCKHFYFKVFRGKGGECYHLTAAKIAKEAGEYDEIELRDDEYPQLLRLLLKSMGGGKIK